ncbi:plexin-C1-like, partial [Clarias magur]
MAVGNGKVFVVTDSRLHQMRHSLSEEKVREISNNSHPNAVTILLPFEANKTLIICGTAECGYCDVLDINDITQTIYRENSLPLVPRVNESYIGFLVNYSAVNGTYMLVGRENGNEKQKDVCIIDGGVTLRNTLQTQHGDIFSKTGTVADANIKVPPYVHWVDGFQASSQSYLFANKNFESKVFFLKLENNKEKSEMMKSLKVATLFCCEDKPRHKLVSSAFISSETSVLWIGIFTAEDPHHSENTALAIFNITAITESHPSDLKDNPWDSQFVLDTDYKSGCAKVLYRADDDRMVFPKILFDPVDHNYIYIALRNQIKRVAVAECGMYSTMRACIGSMDPFCGWCGNTNRCSMQEQCPGTPWISISQDSFQKKLMSFQVAYLSPRKPEILSLQPNEVSFHGSNNAVITGKNLDLVVKVRFKGFMACSFTETPVLERSNDTLKFHIPSGNKETVKVFWFHTLNQKELRDFGSFSVSLRVVNSTVVCAAGIFIHRKSQRQMNAQMNDRLEMLENEIRNEIRQGFVDLQTESSDLVENVGAIPYLDYKHFALKIFFPEDAMKAEMDERGQAFFALIRDPTFLTCFVHALEEQRTFSIKDKCTVASLLTVTLHSDLPYLTLLMEELLQSLMDQPSNAQPKLLLRRTESIVEKLLTNWMSICLYGFLRESVGHPLFLMISALNQQISKGPVDAVTEKALYTLNEDWLLWQAQGFNFSPL